MGGMASAAANDVSNAFNYDKLPAKTAARHRVKTQATLDRNKANEEYYRNDDKPAPRQSTMARAATVSSSGVAPVASAPDLPNPDAVGETEQALLDANRKGRSSTIATSPAGLLAGDDSTRKKRSLMGGLIR
tara:strand:- start:488 stop:883 length:396 start_codon:yes stop_codon:yes gene_type:complete